MRPFAKAGIAIVVLDTGSTDRTIEVTKQFFKEYKIHHGYIYEQPFVDFATSRNYALYCAEQKFPQADFLLMIDAEWQLQNTDQLLQFCRTCLKSQDDSYFVRIIMNSVVDFFVPRLIRPRCGVKFVGVVHEVLNRITVKKAPDAVYFDYKNSKASQEKSRKRWLRDRDLLLREHQKNPLDSRTVFYLAQTCHCLGYLEEAGAYYSKRCAIKGFDEEDFIAHYRLAQTYQARGFWDSALFYYMHAFSLRSSRAEPIICVADYYIGKQQYALGYLFAYRACTIPYPHNDVLFIDKEYYDYVRHDLLGQSAWYVEQYEIGLKAVRAALLEKPYIPHLLTNLQLYVSKEALKPKPRLSIITYLPPNSHHIDNFLATVTQQSLFDECELIILDTNTRATVASKIRSYQKKYPNIIYIQLQHNLATYAILNIGISLSSADFITYLPVYEGKKSRNFTAHIQTLENNNDNDLVYTKLNSSRRSQLYGATIMWRKSIHAKYGAFCPAALSEYYDFWHQAISKGAKCVKK